MDIQGACGAFTGDLDTWPHSGTAGEFAALHASVGEGGARRNSVCYGLRNWSRFPTFTHRGGKRTTSRYCRCALRVSPFRAGTARGASQVTKPTSRNRLRVRNCFHFPCGYNPLANA